MRSKHPHIIIVGAGVVGASIAYHLARQNARVTLIDKAFTPANETTKKSFAWINAGHDASKAYLHFRQGAIADWHRVENEMNGLLKVNWSGALTWLQTTEETERIADEIRTAGYPVRLVDQQEIRLLEPNLKRIPDVALFAKNDGSIDPVFTTNLFVKAAKERGADIQLGNEVLSFIIHGLLIAGVVTANGNVMADLVVVTAGADTNTLCQPFNLQLPVNLSPAILMEFHTAHRFVNRIVSNPFMEVRAASDTLTVAAEDYIDDSTENNPQAIAQRTLATIKNHWQGAEPIQLVNVMVGKRPMPKDSLPIIGRTAQIEGLYLSVMHSGVTLAAIAGRLAAEEILSGQEDISLSPYRPGRFN